MRFVVHCVDKPGGLPLRQAPGLVHAMHDEAHLSSSYTTVPDSCRHGRLVYEAWRRLLFLLHPSCPQAVPSFACDLEGPNLRRLMATPSLPSSIRISPFTRKICTELALRLRPLLSTVRIITPSASQPPRLSASQLGDGTTSETQVQCRHPQAPVINATFPSNLDMLPPSTCFSWRGRPGGSCPHPHSPTA